MTCGNLITANRKLWSYENSFCCNIINVKWMFWIIRVKKSNLMRFKNAFLEVIFEIVFWRLSLDFLWKSKPCWFPEVYYFSKNLWCSCYHQLKALVIRNNFYCYNINVKLICRDTNVKKSSLMFLKNACLKKDSLKYILSKKNFLEKSLIKNQNK